jgi:tRNA-splicing ligase RtcB (3'-phosphate/5'-hydroxy nucleic acid ligase)
MPATKVNDRLYSWASLIERETLRQAERTSRLPIVAGHVALMPDAHIGMGATIGSVIPTGEAIIPSAVGVDIGCGMIAARLDLTASQLPDDLGGVLSAIERAVPAGLGEWHAEAPDEAQVWYAEHPNPALTAKQVTRALEQFGTLGSGNHFFEMALDEKDRVWLVMHSGSRGVGNQLATKHIKVARTLADTHGLTPEDPELAWLQEGMPQFDAYVRDMLWAQEYAMANRDRMMAAAQSAIFEELGRGKEVERVNCHHNFAAREEHAGRQVWITRKGAIRAERGDLGVIPGAMGGRSYIVRGRGEPLSWRSCAHGAGRVLSRRAARKKFAAADLATAMEGRIWQQKQAQALLDEIPAAYKDIDIVMNDQRDLVEIIHELRGIVNYKGTS